MTPLPPPTQSNTNKVGGGSILANYQTNANVIRMSTAMNNNAGAESEHNISNYEDVNGSFILDEGNMGDGQTGLIYENATEKLRAIAIQLGEACLTNDLAALISQKRDRELAESARKVASSPNNY